MTHFTSVLIKTNHLSILTDAKEEELNKCKTETAGALNHFCGLFLMFSCAEESDHS